jgi:hypothetical protein
MLKSSPYMSAGTLYVYNVSATGGFKWSRTYGGYNEVKVLDTKPLPNGDFSLVFKDTPVSSQGFIKYTTINGTHGDPTPNVTLVDFNVDSYVGRTGIGGAEILSDGIVVTGSTSTSTPGIWKFNFNGDLIFSKTFAKNANGNRPLSVKKTSDGGYIMAGYETGVSYDDDYFIIKTDASGNEQWRKVIAGVGETSQGMHELFYSVTEDANGNFVAVGSSNSLGFTDVRNEELGWSHAGILKFDKNGNTIETYHYGGISQTEELLFADTNKNNQVTLIGYSGSHDGDMEGIKFSNSTDDDILFMTLKQ